MKRKHWYNFIAPTGRPLRWGLPALLLVGLLLLQWLVPGWAARAEAWTVDARFRLRGVEEPRNPIVIVALDEASFQMLGDLHGENIRTWPRARWAELVDKIAAGEPRIIGLDAVFDTPGWDAGGDEALAEALAAAGNLVLPAHLRQAEGTTYGAMTLSPPVSPLVQAAAGVGLVNLPVDADGAIRRVTLLWPWGGESHPAFSLVIATLFAGEPVNVDQADLGDDLSLPIHFRGPEGTFHTVSMHEVWLGEADPQVFHDAIVLVGYTTQLEQDRHPAPFAGRAGMPGVEIQANAVDTLLAGDWLYRPPAWLPVTLVGAAGLGAVAALNLRRAGLGIVVLLGVLVVYLVLGLALFAWADYLLPLVAPTATAVAVGGTALAERMVFAEREKRQLRRRLAGVMSPERLQAVMENWEALLQIERPQKEVAVLFADVRGFTNATETLMRQGRVSEMVRFLTAYLDAMSDAVFAEGGVIYDVVGDGLLILFGVPEPFPDYALRAVQAAVDMALATQDLQAVWPLRDQHPLGMGIGVHCGSVVDAVVGRGRRINYAVVGDPVNTAARIQDHCKAVMGIPRPPGGRVPEAVTILISADLYERVREHALVDESVPPFEARGKSEPLRVVRLLGLRDDVL
jgi:adenylate cyclase